MMKILILLFCAFAINLCAQTSINGYITDGQSIPLAFVAVLPNNDVGQAVLSDIEGRFSVSCRSEIKTLEFRYVGMQTLKLDVQQWGQKKWDVRMEAADFGIQEVMIRAGENPADILMKNDEFWVL